MLPKYRRNSTSKLAVLLVTGGMIAVSSFSTLAKSTGGDGVSSALVPVAADALSKGEGVSNTHDQGVISECFRKSHNEYNLGLDWLNDRLNCLDRLYESKVPSLASGKEDEEKLTNRLQSGLTTVHDELEHLKRSSYASKISPSEEEKFRQRWGDLVLKFLLRDEDGTAPSSEAVQREEDDSVGEDGTASSPKAVQREKDPVAGGGTAPSSEAVQQGKDPVAEDGTASSPKAVQREEDPVAEGGTTLPSSEAVQRGKDPVAEDGTASSPEAVQQGKDPLAEDGTASSPKAVQREEDPVAEGGTTLSPETIQRWLHHEQRLGLLMAYEGG
ncbi:hypothetical protein [Pasteuria penetrans]|uniref:hypothetical protein n=1 Tax=Pasteuria penetrans TaxID=86005 RepID=UPI0011EC3B89|nr:hypothetical protein [Pasteuria penetrans]